MQSNRCEDADVTVRSELEENQQRNKLIKIEDRHGWDTGREYTLHPLAEKNEDAAKIRSAIARASRKRWSAMKGDLHLFLQQHEQDVVRTSFFVANKVSTKTTTTTHISHQDLASSVICQDILPSTVRT